ncbi:MAG: CoA-binding protein, partial [Syntrophales bacterium]|nr:CoA-binding protein [Syntrophales bacterium]
MSENPLHLLMNPASIAVAGASNDYRKMGTIQTLSILKEGYQGRFYPIHPKEDNVLGHRAYRSVADLPEAPDLAVLIVPGPVVPSLLKDFGKRGTRRAIIVTAGFRETGEEGRRREEEIKAVAAQYGIRFVGPNCVGVINAAVSLNTTVAPFRMKPGYLGFASQSGTYVTQVLPFLRSRGIRFSKALSLGNEADINIIDALEYLGEDDQTRAI